MGTQHASLSAERWSEFSLDQQILMIGNEMHRAAKFIADGFRSHLSNAYERVLALTDLAIAVQSKPGLRRELLRWRDLIAALYISKDPDIDEHNKAFRVLLLFTPVASEQIPYVLPS